MNSLSPRERSVLDKLLSRYGDEAVLGERDLVKQTLLAHPDLFILHYFGHQIEHLKDFQAELLRLTQRELRLLALLPAQHGKTTLLSTKLPIYELCKNPDVRITLIAKNDQDAQSIMRSIIAELEGNKRLIADFGPFRPPQGAAKPWGTEQLSIQKRSLIDPRATIEAYGSGANVLGHRGDLWICDDIVTEKNSANEEQRERLKEYFDVAVETGPVGEGRLVVVGTRFHMQDLYGDVEARVDDDGLPIYRTFFRDAVVGDFESSIWPEVWSVAALRRIRAGIGSISFDKRYRNRPRDASLITFREEWIQGSVTEGFPGCLDYDRGIGAQAQWRVFTGFDPAVGTSKDAKFCGTAVIGQDPAEDDEKYYIVDLGREQLTMPSQVNHLLNNHMEYAAFCTVTESNGYQRGLHQFVMQTIEERGLPKLKFMPHQTGREKLDPDAGVSSLAPLVENGLLRFPYGTPEGKRKSKLLIEEMISYPQGKYSDILMALWFAVIAARKYGKSLGSVNLLRKRGDKMWLRGSSSRHIKRNPWYEQGAGA